MTTEAAMLTSEICRNRSGPFRPRSLLQTWAQINVGRIGERVLSRRLVIDMKRGKRVSILGVLLSVKLDGVSSASLMVMEPVVPRLKCCDLMQFAPPRNAMRQIHAHRQEERKLREQEKEAEEFENEMSMNLAGKMLIVNSHQWLLTGSWIQVQFVKDLCFRIGSCTATRYYLICQGAVALT